MSAPVHEIRVGVGSCGLASGAGLVLESLEGELRRLGRSGIVKSVGCSGMCHAEPLVEVVDARGRSTLYGHVTPAFARRLPTLYGVGSWPARLGASLVRGARDMLGGPRVPSGSNGVGAVRLDTAHGDARGSGERQHRIVLENCGVVDPGSIDDAIANYGYAALRDCLESKSPEAVIDEIRRSGLRGRGGAGFPTGAKWALCREQPEGIKYAIANGDEGDPGAFMDRLVLESDPHRVVEGLAIAAWAIGASQAYFYIRAEYPLAVAHIRRAIEQAREAGFLGENILESGFSLEMEVREGAGAFVCGEETALIASLEGRRGTPRLRPPFPVQSGLRGKPTSINNVETLACVPWILRHGAGAFAELGTETSTGTKVFALAGKVRRGGLIEVPMGITIREIVESIGGGVPEGRRLKAVQMGGPSGGCVPASLADTRVDYEELRKTGAIMGSGGMVALDDSDCMVDVARFFLRFTQDESCGKCTFCRVGTKRMLEILDRICEGEGDEHDLDLLEELSDRVRRGSLCGLGQTAPNPVLTTLRYFRDEYETHVREKRCPAGRCSALIHYSVTDDCIGCTLCAQVCPVEAIEFRPHEKHEVNDALCTRCGMCYEACEDDAILIS